MLTEANGNAMMLCGPNEQHKTARQYFFYFCFHFPFSSFRRPKRWKIGDTQDVSKHSAARLFAVIPWCKPHPRTRKKQFPFVESFIERMFANKNKENLYKNRSCCLLPHGTISSLLRPHELCSCSKGRAVKGLPTVLIVHYFRSKDKASTLNSLCSFTSKRFSAY